MSKQGMMERLDWYIELRKLCQSASENEIVSKPRLLQSVAEKYLALKLKPAKDFIESSSVQGFSYDEVWGHIENMPRTFSWDDLLNSFSYLNSGKTSCQAEPVNLVQAKSANKIEEIKSPEKGTLKEDFPLVKFYNLNEISMNRHLKFLSLGGNLISNANYEFPAGLVVLNLSHNKISDFLPVKPLVNLKFLNLSYNLIENLQDITGIITILELFLANNKLSQANFLFSIKNLNVLDLSCNAIENFEDIALLCTSSKLQTLSLLGNPLSLKSGYKTSVKSVVSSLIFFDPQDSQLHSNFRQVGFSEPRKLEKTALGSQVLKPNFSAFSEFICQKSNLAEFTAKTTKNADKPVAVVVHRAASPKTVDSAQSKHKRSRSNAGGTLPTTPSLNGSRLESPNKRCKSIVVNKSNTTKPKLKEFGNPMNAMMIGPPAVSNIFKGKVRTLKLDMTRVRSKVN